MSCYWLLASLVMCVFVTIGTVIQTAAVNLGMFLAGRVLAGYAVGLVLKWESNKNTADRRQQGISRNGPNLSQWNISSSPPRPHRWHLRLRYFIWHHDVQLGWIRLWLCALRVNSMASASRSSDPLGLGFVCWSCYLHARFTKATHPKRQSRPGPHRVPQDSPRSTLTRGTRGVCFHASTDTIRDAAWDYFVQGDIQTLSASCFCVSVTCFTSGL